MTAGRWPPCSARGDIRDVVVHELARRPAALLAVRLSGTRVDGRRVYSPGRRSGWSSIEVGRTIEKGATSPARSSTSTELAGGTPVHLPRRRGAARRSPATIAGDDARRDSTSRSRRRRPTTTTIAQLALDPDADTAMTAPRVSAPLAASPSFAASPRRADGDDRRRCPPRRSPSTRRSSASARSPRSRRRCRPRSAPRCRARRPSRQRAAPGPSRRRSLSSRPASRATRSGSARPRTTRPRSARSASTRPGALPRRRAVGPVDRALAGTALGRRR